MGSSQTTGNLIHSYSCQNASNGLKILSSKSDASLKYLLKTYNTASIDQHGRRIDYLRRYQASMSRNAEITRLVDIIEEKEQSFCSNTYKTHLVFQYSEINLFTQCQLRKSKLSANPNGERLLNKQYFSYEDLCNILYSCLSALWLVQDAKDQGFDPQRKQFNTIFLTADNILVFEDGAIKIMDPLLVGYDKRYVFSQKISYSPQKLQNFYMKDDEKSSIFQLGMLLLQISLLQSVKTAYSGSSFNEQVVSKKLYKARKLYYQDLQKTLGTNLFDIIQKMITKNREKRLNLQQTIKYAEEMYTMENQAPSISILNSSKKKQPISSGKKMQLKLTNHSSSGKKQSPSLEKFYDFKNSISHHNNCLVEQEAFCGNSPKVSNFTIQQASPEKEQSSMLQSFKIRNPNKVNFFSESLLKCDVFSTLNLNSSYNYNHLIKKRSQQQLFTDPRLLQTINNQLQKIEQRKFNRSRANLQQSQTLQRKDRYHIQEIEKVTISNKVYLVD